MLYVSSNIDDVFKLIPDETVDRLEECMLDLFVRQEVLDTASTYFADDTTNNTDVLLSRHSIHQL